MPPNAAAKRGPGRGANKSIVPPAPPSTDAMNNDFYVKLSNAIAIITGHAVLSDIRTAQPYTIEEGASKAPFSEASCTSAFTNGDGYECTGNFFWIDFMSNLHPGIKVLSCSVKRVQNRHYTFTGKEVDFIRIKHVVHCIVPPGAKPASDFGKLHRISPIEFLSPPLFACASDIEQGATDARIRQWRAAFLTAKFEFKQGEVGGKSYKAIQYREDLKDDADSVYWTTIQRVQTVMQEVSVLAGQGESISSDAVSQHMLSKIDVANGGEKYSREWIDVALTMNRTLLPRPIAGSKASELDEKAGSKHFFDSAYKHQAAISKCNSDGPKLDWFYTSMLDEYDMGILDEGSYSVKKLRSSTVPLSLSKKDALNFLHLTWLPSTKFTADEQRFIIACTTDHASIRSRVEGYPNSPKPDLFEFSTKTDPVKSVVIFIKDLCFSKEYDAQLKQGFHYGKSAESMLQSGTLKKELDDILEALEKEHPTQPKHKTDS